MYTYASQDVKRNVQLKRDLEFEQGKSKKDGLSAESRSITQLQQTMGNQAVMQLLSTQTTVQRQSGLSETPNASRENRTGMPDNLKSGLEQLSGMDLSDVNVHYNSDKPAQLDALAYAQGKDIHVGPGQEKHLPHEGWHVVQQMQGRVQPTTMEKNAAINDDAALEAEADRMGTKALQMKAAPADARTLQMKAESAGDKTLQKKVIQRQQTEIYVKDVTGTYTDNTGSHEFTCPGDTYITTTKSHPKGKVNYDDQVKKMLKKNGIVPKTVEDSKITVSYQQYGKKL